MTEKKVAIFPAAGALGTSVYTHLAKLLPPRQLILISRNPNKIPKELVEAGAEVRKADYNAPETLKGVFDGADYLFLISYPSIEIDHRFHAHQHAVESALQSGTTHIFYTSLGFGGDAKPDSHAHVMQAHLKTEGWLSELAESRKDFTYTAIREGIYSETFPMYTAFFDTSNPVASVKIPHDGSAPGIAWVKIDELGEASAKLVKELIDNPDTPTYRNSIVVLSGSRAWTLLETVQMLGKLTGKEISIEQVSEEQHAKNPLVIQNMSSHGPGNAAKDWTTVFKAVEAGETATQNGTLERLLGRKPEDFETTVKRIMRK